MKVVATISYDRLHQIGVGQGANSEVYLAKDPQLDGTFVVKEMQKTRLDPTAYFAEAQAMFASSCKNVVPIQYACQTNDHICLVMPFYPNGSLADRIRNGPLPPRDAVRIFLKVLYGLQEIHAHSFIHFDVKPSNILFDHADEPMVADFGQARPMTAAGAAQIPPLYPYGFAPEAITTGAGTVEFDVFQCGLSLYRAVNGDDWFKRQTPATDAALVAAVKAGAFPPSACCFR